MNAVSCPTCLTRFDAGAQPPGSETSCPKCRTIVVVPAPPPALVPVPTAAPIAAVAKPPLSIAAIIGLVLGILGVCVAPLAIAALLVCAIAFLRIRALGLRGTVPAVIGTSLAGLSCAAYLLFFYLSVLPNFQKQAGTAACHARLNKVGRALGHYYEENERLPETLRDLVAADLLDPADCFCPAMTGGPAASYAIVREYDRVRAGDRGSNHGRGQRLMVHPGGDLGWFEGSDSDTAIVSEPEDPRVPADPVTKVKPPRYDKKVWLKPAVITWTGPAPFDPVEELRSKLAAMFILATPGETEGTDGVLEVALEERKGPLYTNGESGTILSLRVSLTTPGSPAPLRIAVAAWTPALVGPTSGGLRAEAVEGLRKHPAYRVMGTLLGAALGLESAVAPTIRMTIDPGLRSAAREALERVSPGQFSPADQAFLAISAGEIEACESFGAAATPALIQSLAHGEHDIPAALLSLGRIGDPAAVAPILGLLRSPSIPEDVALAALEALGAMGDPSARPDLEWIAGSGSGEIAASAKVALSSIERRKK